MLDISLSLHKIFVAFTSAFAFWLGMWVLLSGKKSRINQFFFLITLSIIGWIIFGFLCNFSERPLVACFWCRVNVSAVFSFFLFLYFFSLSFPKRKKSHLFLDLLVIFISSVFIFISIFTGLLVKEVEKTEWGSEIKRGSLFNPFLVSVIFLTFLILFNLTRDYFSLSFLEKLKIKYFLIGSFLFAGFNLIFNVFFPLYKGTFKYYQFGDYSAIFFLFFVALSIVKRKLFGIRVILVEMLVGLTSILLVLQIFLFRESLFQFIWSLSLFLLFLILGTLLIKAVLKEIKQKEKLEKALSEIKRLNLTLEEKVKKRTKELQKRVEELNKFYRLTVGRELKMAQLKEKIRKLEEEIKKFKKKGLTK